MSFRRRLTLALVLILLVPVGAVAILLFRLSAESREGKADARLAGALPAVESAYGGLVDDGERAAALLARDEAVQAALVRGHGLSAALADAARRSEAAYAAVLGEGGGELAAYGESRSIARAGVRLETRNGGVRLVAATTTARDFARRAAAVAGVGVIVARDGVPIAYSGGAPPDVSLGGRVPRSRDLALPDGVFRARVVALPDALADLRLALVGPRGEQVLSSGQLLIGIVVGAMLLVALVLLVPLLRDLQRLHDRVSEEAVTDELTGLANQRRFRQMLNKEAERARRFNRPLCVLILDLDDFKHVNDGYGHLEGDHVLRQVAAILAQESREVDEPARYGGEEFAIVLPETQVAGAVELAERIRTRIASTPIALSGRNGVARLTVSIGAAGTPDHRPDPRRLVQAADEALYEAKRRGKDRVVRAAPEGAAKPLETSG